MLHLTPALFQVTHSIIFCVILGDVSFLTGCGVAIHSGTSCTSVDAQVEPFVATAWTGQTLTSNDDGVADFAGVVDLDTSDIEGKVFVSEY